MKDDTKEITDSNKTIELEPKSAFAYGSRGIDKVKRGDFKGAITDFSKAIELEPKNADAYSSRGFAKNAMKDY